MKWKTAQGKKLNIKDMDDNHLINTIHFLEKKAKNEYNYCMRNFPCMQGEIAQEVAENGYYSLAEEGYELLLPKIYFIMIKHAIKRKLLDKDYL